MGTWLGVLAVVVFALVYLFVVLEEHIELRKSKVTLIGAGVLWAIVALVLGKEKVHEVLDHHLLEYGKLLLFLVAAMTFVNTLEERNLFGAFRGWLIARRSSFRTMFWMTGAAAFFISPLIDNLTTALVVGSVVVAIGGGDRRFVVPGCVNVVVGANAGGAFSPFGDITTLMVWQAGELEFFEFFRLFVPSLVNWAVPAAIMSLALPKHIPEPIALGQPDAVKKGGYVIAGIFLATVALAVTGERKLGLPPVMGMMFGLGVLMLYCRGINLEERGRISTVDLLPSGAAAAEIERYWKPREKPFDIFVSLKRAEWDTLLFFFGIILSVGALAELGHLARLSEIAYGSLGPTITNVLVGLASSVIDNIPVMYAILDMDPTMDHGQWLLVTLTAGVGGSLLSVGSAAGVALMGKAKDYYTFSAHLKWTWAVALGYVASIAVHLLFV